MEDSACSPTVGNYKDPWILQVLLGLHIEFIETPSLTNVPASQLSLSLDHRAVLSAEIADLERKEAIHCLSPNNTDLGFYSNVFAVPKKGRGWRQVINLMKINAFIQSPHFKWRISVI